jgi:hypothetical protein
MVAHRPLIAAVRSAFRAAVRAMYASNEAMRVIDMRSPISIKSPCVMHELTTVSIAADCLSLSTLPTSTTFPTSWESWCNSACSFCNVDCRESHVCKAQRST